MTEAHLKAIIYELLEQVAPEADPVALSIDADWRRELGLDSRHFREFLAGIEEQTGTAIPPGELTKINTLRRLIHYLMERHS